MLSTINYASDIKVFHRHSVSIDSAYGYQRLEVPVFEVIKYNEAGKYENSIWATTVEHALYILGEEELDTDPVGFLGTIEDNKEVSVELLPVYKFSELLVNAVSQGDIACAIVLIHLNTSLLRQEKNLSVKKDNSRYPFFPYFNLFEEVLPSSVEVKDLALS